MSRQLSKRVELVGWAATEELGKAIGAHLRTGQGVALCGELGAGKTCLARGLSQGLAIDDPEAVCSPTYLLVMEHPGPVPLLHVDAYLPGKTRAFLEEGGVDYLAETRGVVVVEWADRVADLLPPDTLWITLAPASVDGVEVRVAHLEDRTGGVFAWIESLPAEYPG